MNTRQKKHPLFVTMGPKAWTSRQVSQNGDVSPNQPLSTRNCGPTCSLKQNLAWQGYWSVYLWGNQTSVSMPWRAWMFLTLYFSMSMCVCVCICFFVCKGSCVCAVVRLCVNVHVRMHVCMHVCFWVLLHICVSSVFYGFVHVCVLAG